MKNKKCLNTHIVLVAYRQRGFIQPIHRTCVIKVISNKPITRDNVIQYIPGPVLNVQYILPVRRN